jgi:hypothetical protein
VPVSLPAAQCVRFPALGKLSGIGDGSSVLAVEVRVGWVAFSRGAMAYGEWRSAGGGATGIATALRSSLKTHWQRYGAGISMALVGLVCSRARERSIELGRAVDFQEMGSSIRLVSHCLRGFYKLIGGLLRV